MYFEESNKWDGKQIAAIIILVAVIVVCVFLLFRSAAERGPDFFVWHSYPEGSAQANNISGTILPEIEKKFRGIKTASVYLDEDKILDEGLRAKNDGTLPDVMFLSTDAMVGMIQNDMLLPIGRKEGFYDFIYATAKPQNETTNVAMVDERIYGVVSDVSVQVLLYNPELLSRAGISPPDTLTAFWADLETMSAKNMNITCFVLPDTGIKSLAPFVWSEGGELVSSDGKNAYNYLNSSTNLMVFEKFFYALDRGQIVIAGNDTDVLAMFAEGKAAMTIIDTKDIDAFKTKYPDMKFEIAPFPAGTRGAVSVLNCKFICITTGAKKDAAGTFLADAISMDMMKSYSAFTILETAFSTARLLPASFSMRDMRNEFTNTMGQIASGYKTIQDALDDLARKWDGYLQNTPDRLTLY